MVWSPDRRALITRSLAGGVSAVVATLAGPVVVRASGAGGGVGAPPAFFSAYGQFIQLQPRPAVPHGPIDGGVGPAIDFATLAGKVVVLNFWATWCVPCIQELPSLDRLAAKPNGLPVEVVPIALDAPDQATVRAFFQAHGIRHLPVHIDPRRQIGHLGRGGGWGHPFPLTALPTTYLIDPRGFVAGYVPGAADWDSPRARALIMWVAQNG